MIDSSATVQPTKETTQHGGGAIGKLGLALSQAQKDFKAIKKDRTAKVKTTKGYDYEYHYADLANVIDCVKDALAANKIAYTQPTRISDRGLVLCTILIHESGETSEGHLPIPLGLSPQELGSHLTYMRRYGLCTALGVSAEEDDDGKAAQDATKTQAKEREASRAKAAAPEAPKTNGLWLNDGGSGSTHGSVSAYLDALDRLLSRADDPAAMFDLNAATLQEQQAKAVNQAKTNPKAQAIVGRIKAIFDHVHAGTVPGLAAE